MGMGDRHRGDSAPPGLSEEIVRFISAKKEDPHGSWKWRLKGVPQMGHHDGTDLAERPPRAIDLPSIIYYFRAEGKSAVEQLDEVDPELLETFRQAGHLPRRAEAAVGRGGGRRLRPALGSATTFKDKLGKLGIIFCSFSEAVFITIRTSCRRISLRRPYTDNLLCRAELRRLQRWVVLLHPEGRPAARWSSRLLPHPSTPFHPAMSMHRCCTVLWSRCPGHINAAAVGLVARRRRCASDTQRPRPSSTLQNCRC